MRKPIMAGNWKMNKTRDEALQFIYAVNEAIPSIDQVETVVFAPAIILRDLVKRQGDNLRIGAQTCHYLENGAFTGEISPVMIKAVGVSYCLVGHSERREYYNETDKDIALKVAALINNGIRPILCIGETLEARESGKTEEVLRRQLHTDLENVSIADLEEVVIAYEPIWAIGTGKTASPEIAEETCKFIRDYIAQSYNQKVADRIRILYGGSVKPSNVNNFIKEPDIDGCLVGGASLDPASFIELCNACK
ncbi:MAG: triose-phosphate isomerase [Clostridium sp.]|nr:MAG: triose-phosphate isomerase [Clostridium sp.]